jgi:NAD(P)H-flavin reductase
MSHYKGVLKEILLEPYQNASGVIRLPIGSIPRPGQYFQAHSADPKEVVPTSLFPAGSPFIENGESLLPISGQLRKSWAPGTELFIRGPLGDGFSLPKRAKRVALISLEPSPGKLIPLCQEALNQSAEISLITEGAPADIPLEIEVQSITEASNTLTWAAYIGVSLSIDQVDNLSILFPQGIQKRITVEILMVAPMPCSGQARCGVCCFETARGIRFPCEDGPVFQSDQIPFQG